MNAPSTQAWPCGTTTSGSAYGGNVFTRSPSRAIILFTSTRSGSSGELDTNAESRQAWRRTYHRYAPEGNNIASVKLLFGMDRIAVEQRDILRQGSVGIQRGLNKMRDLPYRRGFTDLHAPPRNNLQVIEVV